MNPHEVIATARYLGLNEHEVSVSTCQRNGPENATRATLRRFDEVLRSSASLDDRAIACRTGCSYCCYIRVVASPVEIFGLIDYLKATLDLSAYRAFEQRVRAAADIVRSLSTEEHLRTNVACPALQDSKCIAYAARPLRCRGHHSWDAQICINEHKNPEVVLGPVTHLPGRALVSGAHIDGFEIALTQNGYDAGAYELISALREAIVDSECKNRFNRRERAFLLATRDRVSPLVE
ncbi:YkgJ family cysteine cluster protein [Pseudomonas sp. CDFA 610]|uniref:YkgJ family cysteine cluster protein n=1 Tax=Pseudomonas sp. CDFA 610 TaxID=2829825 RepID=UPI003FA6C190